jgi:signal transduction histidine kinase/CheY-like chemotaxis protein
MLSVSIRLQGGLAGVVRHEQAARSREWTPEEQQFSVSIADLVSMALAGSKRRQLEEQLRQSQKMEAVGILAGGIAHDFNNLLTAILGYSEIMLMHLAAEDPMRGHVLEVRKAGERAAALTGQLLAFSRKQVLDPKVFDLKSTVENMHGMLRRIIGEDIDLVTHSDDDLGLVKADRMQIEQVLLNLVVNAREAMPHGGKLLIELRNDVLGDSETRRISGPVVRLSVTDNGQGMDAATRERIFDPFFTTKDQKGTGLGLSTVYGIVQQSGGHIEVDSDPGRGARFHVYLPHVDEVLADVIEPATATVSTPPKGSEVILLVEDEDQVRKLTRDILKTCGYTVLEAPHGGEALLLCERFQKTIDLLVTDIVMPHMTGCELYQRLVRLRPNMKVLYMSGYTDRGVVQHGTLKAGTDLIRKPFGPLEIAIRVREVLDVRQAEVACGTGTRT